MTGTRLAKLRPPALPRVLLPRPGIAERLHDGSHRRLTALTAGAGYGKTTALAAWAENTGAAWYSLDRADAAVSVLLNGVVDALRLRLPALPADASDSADAPGAPDSNDRDRVEALVARLADVVAGRIDRHQALVLDNVEELPCDGAAAVLVQALVRHAPAELHLVLASRRPLPFAIDRLRGRGEVLELGVDALRLSRAETDAFVSAVLDAPADGLAAEVHRLTSGWPAAVRLATEALRDVPTERRAAALAHLRRPESGLSSFLAGEVLANHSPAARELLRRVSALPYFTADLAVHLGVDDAADAVAELQQRDGLLQAVPDPDGCYVVNPLVADCVQERYPLPGDELAALRRGAAEWFAGHRRYRDAVGLIGAAADARGMGALLADHGADMLAAGAIDELAEAAALVPASARSTTTEEVVGQALMVAGDWEGALACLQRITSPGVLSAGVAWRIGLIHHLRGELAEALAVYERGQRTPGDSDMEVSLLDAMRASALWVAGQVEASRTAAAAAARLAERIDEPNALAAAHTVLGMASAADGDRRAEHAHLLRALDHARRARNVLQEIRIRVNYASLLNEQGEYRRALAELDVALEQAEVAGFATFHALARSNRGDASRGLGNLDEAMADYQAAFDLGQRLDSRLAVYPLLGIADVHRLRGEVALAGGAYEEALRRAEDAADAQALTPALAGLARCLALGEPERADALLSRALAEPFPTAVVAAQLAAGWVALLRGHRIGAEQLAAEAATTARARSDPAGLAEALELQGLAGEDPRQAGDALREARRIFTRIDARLGQLRVDQALADLTGATADPAAAADRAAGLAALGVTWRRGGVADTFGVLAAHASAVLGPPALVQGASAVRVEVLGGFRVTVDGRAVAENAWQSRKARDLLKVLVARRGQAVPRDILCDTLWPGEDPVAVGNRLSAAMSVLRGVLDPDRRQPPDHHVEATRDTLRLNLAHVDVDVEAFLASAEAALAAQPPASRHLLEAAVARYTGDCLVEDLYEDWAAPLREEARSSHLMLLRQLARAADDPDVTVRTCLRLLGHDRYDEEAHLELVRCLAGAGRHGEAQRHYRVYTGRMAELEIEPMPYPATARSLRST